MKRSLEDQLYQWASFLLEAFRDREPIWVAWQIQRPSLCKLIAKTSIKHGDCLEVCKMLKRICRFVLRSSQVWLYYGLIYFSCESLTWSKVLIASIATWVQFRGTIDLRQWDSKLLQHHGILQFWSGALGVTTVGSIRNVIRRRCKTIRQGTFTGSSFLFMCIPSAWTRCISLL